MKQNCKQCGKEFELTESEINFYKSKNLNIPKRCKACRDKNRATNGDNKESKTIMPSRNIYNGKSYNNYNGHNNIRPVIIAAVCILFFLVAFIFVRNIDSNNSENEANITANNQLSNAEVLVNQTIDDEISIENELDEEALDENVSDEEALDENVSDEKALDEKDADDDLVAGKVSDNEALDDKSSDIKVLDEKKVADDLQTVKDNGNEVNPNVEISDKVNDKSNTGNDTESVATENTAAIAAETTTTYKFRNSKLLNDHYEKHGIEMGFSDAQAYEAAAAKVITNSAALRKTEKEDGDFVFYLEATNEFVILSTDGYIRTYFLPSGAKSYYDRQ